jgi:PTS system ascorbate-specific IIB component
MWNGFWNKHDAQIIYDDILKVEGIKAEVNPWDLGSFKETKWILLVAPIDMESHLRDYTAKVVYINNLVDKAEIKEKVLAAIRELSSFF